MKKLAIAAAIVAGLGFAGRAAAFVSGQNVDVEVIASINSTMQITVGTAAGGTWYDFGTIGGGFQGVSAAFSVTNTGAGLNETYSLSAALNSTPGPWTLVTGAIPAADEFRLYAMFQTAGGAAPVVGGFTAADHELTTTSVASTASKFAGTANGVGRVRNDTVDMYIRLDGPASSSVATAQHMKVTISAN